MPSSAAAVVHKRGWGSVISSPKEVISDLVSMQHTFVSRTSLRKQLLHKIPLKPKGLLFTLARRLLLLETKGICTLVPMTLL